MPGGAGRAGEPERKVEHSDIPIASWSSVPVRARHASRSAGSSRSPAVSPCRRLGIGAQSARRMRRKTPGAAARIVAPCRAASSGICSSAVPSAGISAVAPTVQGSISPVPRVKVQLKAPACISRSFGVSPYQP